MSNPHLLDYCRIEEYKARKTDADEVTTELMAELTRFEKKLIERQDVLEIRGKVQYIMWDSFLEVALLVLLSLYAGALLSLGGI